MLFRKNFQPYCYVKAPIRPLGSANGLLTIVGYGSITLALAGLLVLLSPWMVAESIANLQKIQSQMNGWAIWSNSDNVAQSNPLSTPDPSKLTFYLSIPKLELYSRVVANVDASNQDIYTQALKEGVAHGLGSAFPGQGKMVYIFGHSTDYAWNVANYNALFYQIKDLKPGDEIYLTLGDETYRYQTIEQHIVTADDLSVVENKHDQDVLILQTCYPPGTTWKRLLILAKPVK